MNKFKLSIAALLLFLVSGQSQATLIRFNATGAPNVSGYVQFDLDDSILNSGSSLTPVSNSLISDLMLTVFAENFTLMDVVATAANTFFDFSGSSPVISNGSGILANNGSQAIAFFPGTAFGVISDGDASLVIDPDLFVLGLGSPFLPANATVFVVQWVPEAGGVTVPEPSALMLLGFGLAGIGCRRRRNKISV